MKYTDWDSTPLSWHRFLVYVSLPLGLVSSLAGILPYYQNGFNPYSVLSALGLSWVYHMEILFFIPLFILPIVAAVGLIKRRWFGPCILFCSYGIGIGYGVFLIISASASPTLFGSLAITGATSVLTSGIFLFVQLIYYRKRRLLFSPSPKSPDSIAHPSDTASSSVTDTVIYQKALQETASELEETIECAKLDLATLSEQEIIEQLKSDTITGDEAKRQLKNIALAQKILETLPEELEIIQSNLNQIENTARQSSDSLSVTPPFEPAPASPSQQPYGPFDMPQKGPRGSGIPIWLGIALASLAAIGILISSFLGVRISQLTSAQNQLQQKVTDLTQELAQSESIIIGLRASVTSIRDAKTALQTKYDQLLNSNDSITSDWFFYVGNTRFIIPNSKYLHAIECPLVQDADTYWVHNIEYCQYLGYTVPCPVCYG